MNIGPLEYVVVGVTDVKNHQPFAQALLSELNAIHAKDDIRVVDLILVKKSDEGELVMREVHELKDDETAVYGGIAEQLTGLLTPQDIQQLAAHTPPGSSAMVILFEHAWVVGLAEAVRQGGGVMFAGGMVSPEALQRLSAEIAEKEAQNA